jgi:acid stress-induced BolA-like protein IbaG/YrbA
MLDPADETAVAATLKQRIEAALPDAQVEVVVGGGAHYSLVVRSASFAGKRTLDKQRAVYSAIADLMRGLPPPVHAIDKLDTLEA